MLLDPPSLDNRLHSSRRFRAGCRRDSSRLQFFDDLLPGFFRKLVDKVRTFDGIHLLENRDHLVGSKRVQQNERVVVGKNRGELSGKSSWELPEQGFLLGMGKAHEGIGRNDRVQTIQDRYGTVESSVGNKVVKFLGLGRLHRCFTLLYCGARCARRPTSCACSRRWQLYTRGS